MVHSAIFLMNSMAAVYNAFFPFKFSIKTLCLSIMLMLLLLSGQAPHSFISGIHSGPCIKDRMNHAIARVIANDSSVKPFQINHEDVWVLVCHF